MLSRDMRRHASRLLRVCAPAILLALWLARGWPGEALPPVFADGPWYVAPDGDCGGAMPCYDSVQAAVNAAASGDEIRIAAGKYTGVQDHGAVRALVYISKTLTVQGGYSKTNWTSADPENNPTILDADKLGTVILISGNITVTITGLNMMGGYGDTEDHPGGGIRVLSATVMLAHNFITANFAFVGGGLYLDHASAALAGNVVSENEAYEGGGAYFESGAALLTNNVVASNMAELHGAGLSLNRTAATLDRNVIYANGRLGPHTGMRDGFGVYAYASDVVLTGNIITDNSGDGVQAEESRITRHGNIISNNGLVD